MSVFGLRSPAKPLPVNSDGETSPESKLNKSSTIQSSCASLESRAGLAQSVAQTQYVDMLLSLDSIPRTHNLLAAFSTWILLAGFLIVPGTFTSVTKSHFLTQEAAHHPLANTVLQKVKHVPLLVVACSCCAVGGSGLGWLWWRWRRNYVWLINKIFMVLALNALAGLISTLINVYSQQGGKYSITAKVTVIVTGGCAVAMALLFLVYNNWILAQVRRAHEQERKTVIIE